MLRHLSPDCSPPRPSQWCYHTCHCRLAHVLHSMYLHFEVHLGLCTSRVIADVDIFEVLLTVLCRLADEDGC